MLRLRRPRPGHFSGTGTSAKRLNRTYPGMHSRLSLTAPLCGPPSALPGCTQTNNPGAWKPAPGWNDFAER